MEGEKFQIRDLRNGDWFWVNRLVLDCPYLRPSDKMVYLTLAYFAGKNKQKVYPSLETICRLAGVKRNTAVNSIKKLEEYFFIKVERKEGRVNIYTLLKLTDSRPVQKINWFLPGSGKI